MTDCWRALLLLGVGCAATVRDAKCPGSVQMVSDMAETTLPVTFVPAGWASTDEGAEFEIDGDHVIPHMGSRAYFASDCTAGKYDRAQYMGLNLLGRTLRYTVDLSGAGCGCNAAFYLTSMNNNRNKSECGDYYCDANDVCGESCAEIDIQEANKFAWHSTLHTAFDHSGVGGGFGGGGKDWSGPRDWTAAQYAPGGKCINTSEPFSVAASFPVNTSGWLTGMVVELSQAGHSCKLSTQIRSYEGMAELSQALGAGMTPIVSYWSDDDMLWMDGKGKDGRGPCKADKASSCSETVKFYNFSVGEAAVEGLPKVSDAQPRGQDSKDGQVQSGDSEVASESVAADDFCCLAAADESDVCGSCPSWARADFTGHCGTSESSCLACGGKATWCASAESPGLEPVLPVVGAATMPEAGPLAPPSPTGSFCCLASAGSDEGFCRACFPGARATVGTRCGNSSADCAFCGGQAIWCEQEDGGEFASADTAKEGGKAGAVDGTTTIAQASSSGASEDDGHCCLAAMDEDDVCGSCFPNAIANATSKCGSSKASCETCGGGSKWCPRQVGALTVLRTLERAPAQGSSDMDPFDCKAGLEHWESGWSEDKKAWCCEVRGSPCPDKTMVATTVGGDTTTAEIPQTPAPVSHANNSQAFCCLVASDLDDVCTSCITPANSDNDAKCGKSESECLSCSSGAKWCASVTSDSAARTSNLTSGKKEHQSAPGTSSPVNATAVADSFCCMAGSDASDVCGSCFSNAIAENTSHCGRSEQACKRCGGMSTWCEEKSAPRKAEGESAGDASQKPKGFCCLAAQGNGEQLCGTCFANAVAEPESHCGKSKESCERCGGSATWCEAASSKGSNHTPGEEGSAPKPICPGNLQLHGEAMDSLPVEIVPTGWGSKDGGAPVRVDKNTGINTSLNARAYFAVDCTAGVYSNEDYLAFDLLGKSLHYTVDLSGAGCGCNAALYLTSMRQNTKPSTCSDYYCDANRVCGVACAEIDIQEANMYSWHSTLHTKKDANGVGGGFGGGGKDWSGPRDWNSSQYSPGGTCIDTQKPFNVMASFPIDSNGSLVAMQVTLSQEHKSCPLTALVDDYEGMAELSKALTAGMTPIVSYWSADDMLWMDGKGKDKKGSCKKDHAKACSESVRFYNFSVGVAPTLPPTAAPTPAPTTAPPPKPTCPGKIDLMSEALDSLPVEIVPTGWGSKDGGAPVRVGKGTGIITSLNARAYFATDCTAGNYSNEDYLALDLLGKSLQYTVDLSGAGCGCNAALYLTSMRQNAKPSTCSDYYCDANRVCGVACAEIDIQEANMYSWHSTLHTKKDPNGVGGGFGGGGKDWSGPRDWNSSQYSPGGTCIDTKKPFTVTASFPVDSNGSLFAMQVTLSQGHKSCPLTALVDSYEGMAELSKALGAGMTPIVSYWSADDMLWMDGKGRDKKGSCKEDHAKACSESVRFYNFSIGVAPTLPPTAAPTAAPTAEPTRAPTAPPTSAPAATSNRAGTAASTSAPRSNSTPVPAASNSGAPTSASGADLEAFCCLASPDPHDFCRTCPDFAKAPANHPCAKSESECQNCGGLSRWCAGTAEQGNISDSNSSHKARASVASGKADLRGKAGNIEDKYLTAQAAWGARPGPLPQHWLPAVVVCAAFVAAATALARLPRSAAVRRLIRTATHPIGADAEATTPMVAAEEERGLEVA